MSEGRMIVGESPKIAFWVDLFTCLIRGLD